jgi:putative hydrolase of the HAD superfamily
MKPWVVVFDLDDTLYLERTYVRSGFQAVGAWAAARLGIPDFAAQAERHFDQGIRAQIFDAIVRDAGCAPSGEVVAELAEVYRNHYPAIELLPDARTCLDSLRGRVPCALVTDGRPEAQKQKIAALKLHWMSPVLVTDDWGSEYRKPHPRAFQTVESLYDARRFRFVYVGDNPMKDFTAPYDLGWSTIRLRRPGGLHFDAPNLPDASAYFEIPDLTGLTSLLGIGKMQ